MNGRPMKKEMNFEKVDGILTKYGYEESQIIAILQEIQVIHSYLPEEVLKYVAEELDIPLSRVYSLVTFYKAFSLEPRGNHLISVCLGTTCHVRGGRKILEKIERDLGIKAGETTPDLKFTLETVNCVGCCAVGPIVIIDENYFGEMNLEKVDLVLRRYREG
jgi:NADH:ubiquinone oxidoreductase 24 kD subunit